MKVKKQPVHGCNDCTVGADAGGPSRDIRLAPDLQSWRESGRLRCHGAATFSELCLLLLRGLSAGAAERLEALRSVLLTKAIVLLAEPIVLLTKGTVLLALLSV